MTAIPTITPREVAATPAATSRNMTIYRLVTIALYLSPWDGHTLHVYATAVDLQFPMAQRRRGSAQEAARRSSQAPPRHGLAVIHHDRPCGLHSAGTPSEIPSECFRGRDSKWVAIVQDATAASHVALMPRPGTKWHARKARMVVGHSSRTTSCGPSLARPDQAEVAGAWRPRAWSGNATLPKSIGPPSRAVAVARNAAGLALVLAITPRAI